MRANRLTNSVDARAAESVRSATAKRELRTVPDGEEIRAVVPLNTLFEKEDAP